VTSDIEAQIELATRRVGDVLAAYRWVVEEGHVQQFRDVLRATGAAFVSDERVPLAFTVTTGLWDTSHKAILEQLGLETDRVVHGEQRFDVLRPLEVGVEYTVTQRLSDARLRTGRRGGRMLIVVVETTIADARGEVNAIDWHTSIQLEDR
jgi:hypothetical protein